MHAAGVDVGDALDGAMDLLIAATAVAAGLSLYTRNPGDFAELGALLEIAAV